VPRLALVPKGGRYFLKNFFFLTKIPVLYLDSKAIKAKIDNDIKYFKAYKTEKIKK
jgi:hypothetical protein